MVTQYAPPLARSMTVVHRDASPPDVDIELPRHRKTTRASRFLTLARLATVWTRVRTTGRLPGRSRPASRVLIVGVGRLGRLTHRELRSSGKRRRVIGYLRLDDEQSNGPLEAPVLGSVKDLETVLRERVVNEVYFAESGVGPCSKIQEAIRCCETFGVPFALPIYTYRFARAKPVHGKGMSDGYIHFVSVQHKPIQARCKRLVDIVGALSLLAVLSPLLVATGLAVKATSRGPILFRQRRVGLHGQTFDMLKFRSMVENAEALKTQLTARNDQSGPVFKMKRDPRITKVGRFIRKYSIDELPQLINVLRGEMSLVGPRPPLLSEVARYEAWQRRRLSVRPGLTCVWQVSGRNEIPFEEWMLLDMRYIDHWSLSRDLQLIWRTFPVVLTGRGAS